MGREVKFLLALWAANLQAAMEYRVAFLTQSLGMIVNNALYFLFWVLFFDRFKQVGGWGLNDMFLVFGVAATSFGLAVFLFGNTPTLADLILKGQLDYYLSLPRPVLLHALASRCTPSGLGDVIYGGLSFGLSGAFSLDGSLRFILAVISAACVFISFMVLVQSLAFWIGNAQMLSSNALNAMLTFSLYPLTLFDGSARFILFTILPAAFMGAVPAEFIRAFSWEGLALLLGAAIGLLLLALGAFHRGLRRYESGSAVQVRV